MYVENWQRAALTLHINVCSHIHLEVRICQLKSSTSLGNLDSHLIQGSLGQQVVPPTTSRSVHSFLHSLLLYPKHRMHAVQAHSRTYITRRATCVANSRIYTLRANDAAQSYEVGTLTPDG